MQSAGDKMRALLTVENARNWKTFVADYVSAMTQRKEYRDLVAGYKVVKVAGGYKILTQHGMGDPHYGTLTAEMAYTWFVRGPLNYLAREADDCRGRILGAF